MAVIRKVVDDEGNILVRPGDKSVDDKGNLLVRPGDRLIEVEAFAEGQPFAIHGPFIVLPEGERIWLSDDLRDGTGARGPGYVAPLVCLRSGAWMVRVVREEEYLDLKRKGHEHPARGQFELRIPNVGEDGKEVVRSNPRRGNQRRPEDYSHLHTADDLERLREIKTVDEYRRMLPRFG